MSEVVFRCPYCGQKLSGAKNDVGAEVECPTCGKSFVLEEKDVVREKLPNGFKCYWGMLRNYFGFRGRMRRREFWWAFLFWWIVYLLSVIADLAIWGCMSWCAGVVSLGTFIPLAAAQVRRLHDTDKSGWWMPLILLPPLNLAYFVWLVTDGDRGQNRFGFDPKERS